METQLSEKLRIIKNSTRSFCDRELRPIAREIDQEGRFPWEAADKMGALGYFGIQAPRQLRGAGMDTLAYATVIEEISRVCAAMGLCVSVHNSVALFPILKFGSDRQKTRWAPDLATGKKIGAFCLTEPNAGSDASGIEAVARRDGNAYVVNANKVFVTNGGIADICLIFVRTAPEKGPRGISVLVAERGMSGFVVGDREDLTGMRANPVTSIRLYDCRIPSGNLLGREGQGLGIGLAALDAGRIGIAAQAVGIAQGALEEGARYAGQRQQFRRPLSAHQSIQNMLADMAVDVEAARLLVHQAARLRDAGKPFSQAAAMAKLFAAEAAGRVTDHGVQILGGYGYSKSYAVERYWRDARVTRIYEGTSEIHRMVIARGVMERYGQ